METRLNYPGFTTRAFLQRHIRSILDFYEPVARDPAGGFFHCFTDDGRVYDAATRHLVSSTRFVFNYAHAYRLGYGDHYRQWARHALAFVHAHRQPAGHYAWEITNEGRVLDGRAMAYGQAFVLLAGASALEAGIAEGRELVDDAWKILETLFWEEERAAYADERDASLQRLDPYRGQNANMHACEALLAAYQATGEQAFLDRSMLLAQGFTTRHAAATGGQVWEHYTTDWRPDWEYNQDKPDDLFKPWGFQPGHQAEWAKLLLQLAQHNREDWLLPTARGLLDKAWERGWDKEHGGLVYGYAPQGGFADAHKYFWVMAEAIAAAWRLWRACGEQEYLDKYKQLWRYAWDHLIDHKHGAWFRIRSREGRAIDDLKSPPGKVDYHTLGACWDLLATGGQSEE